MNSIFEAGDSPLSEEEVIAVRQNPTARLRFWKKRSLYSAVALFLSCASVTPFTSGHFLHADWEPLGRLLVYLSMGLFLWFVYCVALLWGAWSALQALCKN